MPSDDRLEGIGRTIIGRAFELHRDLGPGLFESAYRVLLLEILRRDGLQVAAEVPVSIRHKGIFVENAYRMDLLVEDRVLVELKSVEKHSPVHAKQVMTYLKLANLPLGFLINFGMPTFKLGVSRFANGYYQSLR